MRLLKQIGQFLTSTLFLNKYILFKLVAKNPKFDGDYDTEELRLIRIKFISEVAN